MVKRTLESLKEDYKKIEARCGLPSFEVLEEDFDIEKICKKDGGNLTRDIRRVIIDKLSAYLGFFENLLSPASPSIFIHSFLKNTSEKEKKEIKEIYRILSKLQIKSFQLDTIFDERKESEYIKNSFEEWNSLKQRIHVLLENFEKETERDSENKPKSYFG